MPKAKITNVVVQIVELLESLKPEERMRAVQSALVMLGEDIVNPGQIKGEKSADSPTDLTGTKFGSRAMTWMRQNDINSTQLQEVFHLDDGNEEVLTNDIPGKGKKGQTINAYLLQGVVKFLSTDKPDFDDKSARKLCRRLGCYDSANHAVHIKSMGNKVSGSKEKGWVLTAPGLRNAAALIRDITKRETDK